jgi:hypothetical protein
MRKLKQFIFILFILCIFSIKVSGQGRFKSKKKILTFNSLTVGAGIYKPYLEYWNESSYIKDWSEKFTAAPVYSGNMELTILNLFNLRFEAQYWSKKASNNPPATNSLGILNEDISLSLTPLTASLVINILQDDIFNLYLGAGGGMCLINNEININYLDNSTSPAHQLVSGSGNMYVLFQGFNFKLKDNFRAGFETRYTMGSYDQASKLFTSGVKTITLDGVQVLATFSYSFGAAKSKSKSRRGKVSLD